MTQLQHSMRAKHAKPPLHFTTAPVRLCLSILMSGRAAVHTGRFPLLTARPPPDKPTSRFIQGEALSDLQLQDHAAAIHFPGARESWKNINFAHAAHCQGTRTSRWQGYNTIQGQTRSTNMVLPHPHDSLSIKSCDHQSMPNASLHTRLNVAPSPGNLHEDVAQPYFRRSALRQQQFF